MSMGAMSAFSGGMSLGSSLGSIWGAQLSADVQIDFTKDTVALESEKNAAQRQAIIIKRDGEFEALDITSNGLKKVADTEKETAKNNVENTERRAEISKLVSEVKLARMRRDYPVPMRAS